ASTGLNRFSLAARWDDAEDGTEGDGLSVVAHDHHAVFVNAPQSGGGGPYVGGGSSGSTPGVAPTDPQASLDAQEAAQAQADAASGGGSSGDGPTLDTVDVQVGRIDPSRAGSDVTFTFFDIGDLGAGDVTVEVLPPPDANVDSFEGCRMVRDGQNHVRGPSGCTWDGITNRFSGRSVVTTVPLPEDYTCDEADAGGCWLRVRMTFPPGSPGGDTTTWSLGDWSGRVLPGEGPDRVDAD
ncbi:hypothetical protein B7486_67660, partial [cyanobacterium TDX16]